MVDWTDDARDYLEGYLRQVAALARRNGDDVDEIVGGLREHVELKASAGRIGIATLDLLVEVLREVGSPEEVMGVDGLRARGFECAGGGERSVPVARREDREEKSKGGRWIFTAVVVVAFVVMIPVWLAVTAYVIPEIEKAEEVDRQASLRAECRENLEAIGLALKARAIENQGQYPGLLDFSDGMGRFVLDEDVLSSEFLEDASLLACPSVARSIQRSGIVTTSSVDGRDSYVYPYIATRSITDWVFLATQYAKILASQLEGTPLPEGAEMFLFEHVSASDAARVPVLIERPGHHDLDGGHVLFLDGHVELIQMGAKYPMVPEFFEGLKGLEQWFSMITPEIVKAMEKKARGMSEYMELTNPSDPDARKLVECSTQLKAVNLAFKMFTNENRGSMYPSMSKESGVLMFERSEMYPSYLHDFSVMDCPGYIASSQTQAGEIDDSSYVYLDRATFGIEDWGIYIEQYRHFRDTGEVLDTEEERGIYLLSDDPRIMPYADSMKAKIPVLVERPGHHAGMSGGHVAFMDGHVEFIEMGAKYPMVPEFFELLGEID